MSGGNKKKNKKKTEDSLGAVFVITPDGMTKKKRQKSSSAASDVTTKSSRKNAVHLVAGTNDPSGVGTHGTSTACSPPAPRDGPHAGPLTALPGTRDTAGTGLVDSRHPPAFPSPPSPTTAKLERIASGAQQPCTVGAPTSAPEVPGAVTPLDHVVVYGHGKFQWIILLCTMLAVFCTVVQALAMLSLARPVGHWCKAPAAFANLPPDEWKNSSIPVEEDGSHSRCLRYEPPFAPYGRGVGSSTKVPCDAGWEYDVPIHTSVISQWDLVCERHWILKAMMASYMGSTVVVMPFTGIAADRIGRTPVLAVALFCLILAGTTLALTTTLLMFAILRVLVAVSSAALVIVSSVLLFEVTDSSRRVLYSSIAIAGGVSAANVYCEITYELADEWALIQMINMLPSTLLVGAVYFIEESPPWLLATRRLRRLSKVVMSAAQTNCVDLVRVAKRLEGLRKEDRRSRCDSTNEGVNEAPPLEVLTNPLFRSETLVAFGCSFLVMSLFHELRGSHDDRSVHYAQIALECPAVTFNVFLLERKGRRIATAVCMIALGCLVAVLGAFCFILPDPSNAGGFVRHIETAVRVVALLAVDSAAVSLSVITIEMYPTVIRASGASFGYVSGRLGSIAASFASSDSRLGLGIELTVVSLLLLAFAALVLVVMPETTKIHATHTPPDVSARRDAEDKWMLDAPLRIARSRRASSLAHPRHKDSAPSLSKFAEQP
ncbi:solute carrier family 22 member 7-like [Dermacentor albipictus]|uniref:solute carrier family 22 member 7-like n=1 Tax=Dermacentor albipictus TaxID=60249 RepID=UPI0031FDC12A